MSLLEGDYCTPTLIGTWLLQNSSVHVKKMSFGGWEHENSFTLLAKILGGRRSSGSSGGGGGAVP